MNEKCKYCNYVSKCSRRCEYDSVICKLQRSFPKVVDKSYEQLQQENQQLKDNWNYIKKMLKEARNEEFNIIGYCGTCTDVDIDFLLNKMQELQGSDSNE